MNKINQRIRELKNVPETETNPQIQYELRFLEAIEKEYDDCADLTNMLQALHKVYDIVYEQRYAYLQQEREG
jgi:hypothetical protein